MSCDRYFTRKEAADYIASKGLKYSAKTLQKDVTVGGGPTYRRWGNRAVYTQQDLDAWIEAKLTAPRATYGRAA